MRGLNSTSNKEVTEEKYICDKCKDSGLIETSPGKYRYCECRELNKVNKSWRDGGFTLDMLQNKTFDNFKEVSHEVSKMKKLAANYTYKFQNICKILENSIYLAGVPGCGKTHIGCAICRNLMAKKYKPVYMPYVESFREIKQHANDEMYDKLINKYKKAEVLYIDDLLKCSETEADRKILYEIINYRYIKHLPLIISSEKGITYLMNWDQAIGRRVYEMCGKGKYIKQINGAENNYSLREE